MSIIKYEPVHIGDFSSFIENLVSKTKSKRFRAGFIKTDGSYRTGKFDFKYRKTWKQTDGTKGFCITHTLTTRGWSTRCQIAPGSMPAYKA